MKFVGTPPRPPLGKQEVAGAKSRGLRESGQKFKGLQSIGTYIKLKFDSANLNPVPLIAD